ncbi:MAG: acyltransferase [Anaerolineales bacterium]|nr:acyltransferase [Anaerolineales bacterium]
MAVGHKLENEELAGLHKKLFDSRKSNIQKYQELFIGRAGWLTLLRYELTILLLGQLPGALGLALRKIFYKPLFKNVGKNVVFGQNLTIRHPHKISLGDNVIIEDYCLLDAKGNDNEGITIGEWVTLGRMSSLTCKNGNIRIGSHINMGSSVKIVVADGGTIKIEDNVAIGSSCHFSGGSYDYSDKTVLPSARRLPTKGITIGQLTWIGAGVIVLDGADIGNNTIIGAGSIVTKSIPHNTIAAGMPAEVKKIRK